MSFLHAVNRRLETVNSGLNHRIGVEGFASITIEDLARHLTGKAFEGNEFVNDLVEEYSDEKHTQAVLNKLGRGGLEEKFNSLSSDIYAWSDRVNAPSNDRGRVKLIVEFSLRWSLRTIKEAAAYLYIEKAENREAFEELAVDNLENFIGRFVCLNNWANPIILDFRPLDVRQVVDVAELEELLENGDWEKMTDFEAHETIDGERRGYACNVWRLQSPKYGELMISYAREVFLNDDDVYIGDVLNDTDIDLNFDLVDEGHLLTLQEQDNFLQSYDIVDFDLDEVKDELERN